MWLMIQADEPDDYVIATGESHSVRDFLDQAFGYLDLDWKEHVDIDPRYYRPAEVDVLMGDASKARRVLGWEPTISFNELVTLMVLRKPDRRQVTVDGRLQPNGELLRWAATLLQRPDGRRSTVDDRSQPDGDPLRWEPTW